MMSFRALLLGIVLTSTAATGQADAHGTGARILDAKASVIEFYYTDGEPMAYAEAKVFSPASADVPFVNGRADRLGRVAFAPDRDGLWRVDVHDNESHKAFAEVTIGEGAAKPQQGAAVSRWVLFASFALNLAGAIVLIERWRGARRRLDVQQGNGVA